MSTVVLVIHLLLAVSLVSVVLLQRSEGGALGIGGGGGGGGGMMSSRGAGNLLTRATAVLAAAFMMTSMGLSMLAANNAVPRSILETTPAASQEPVSPSVPVGD